MVKKLLWIIWVPLIIVGLVILSLGVVFALNINDKEYEEVITETVKPDYSSLKKFNVTSNYQIVRDDSLDVIADKFNYYVEIIIGSKLNESNTADSTIPCIELKLNTSQAEDYIFSSTDNVNITISGNTKDNLLRGTYAFIEEFGGYKCYTESLYLKTSNVIFFPIVENGGYSKSYTSSFLYKDTDWLSPNDNEYCYFKGINTNQYRYDDDSIVLGTSKTYLELKDDLSGYTTYIVKSPHSMCGEWCNPDKYFNEHPEYYAMNMKEERISTNLCMSNPETLRVVTDEVLAKIKENYNPNGGLQLVTVTQPDDLTGCMCEDCIRRAKEYGSYSGIYLEFVNSIAQAVKDNGYDKVNLVTYAYRYTRNAPTGIVPLDNVIVRLCSIECCSSHYIDDADCAANKAFMEDLKAWSEITSRLDIWDYTANYSHFMDIFPNFKTIAHNIKVYKEHNVIGVYFEGNYNYNSGMVDNEFVELRAYLITEMLKNPDQDYKKVILDFCNAYYGNAGLEMYNFVMKISNYASRSHLNIYEHPFFILIATDNELEGLNNLFETAKEKATGDALTNVLNSEMAWKYYKLINRKFEYKGLKSDEYEQAKLEYFEAQNAIGHTDINETGDDRALINSILQELIVDIYPVFDLVTKIIYGPIDFRIFKK